MTFDTANLIPVLPEIFLLTLTSLVLVIDLFLRPSQRVATYWLAQFTLLGTAAIAAMVGGGPEQVVFDGSVVRDGMSDLLRVAICVIAAGAFIYAKAYLDIRGLLRGEFFVLGLFAVLGMLVMVAANSFLVLYLGLELLALSMYALVAFDRDSKLGSEAAMKYFVLGALASGMLLYGISMIYGATGHISFPEVAQTIAQGSADKTVLVFGLVFVVIGLAFKFGAVPFHMWAPDVYQGAPTATTLFIGSAPKIAAFAMAMRVLADGMPSLHADWQGMLIILAVLSMAVGNLIAIAQTNIKRMLAYSTIAHVGFILLGLLAGSDKGYSAAMFYAVTYALMALGAFGVVILLSRQGFEAEWLDDYKGLHERSPWIAAMMMLLMFSMAGVPPTVGFFSKMFVLEAAIRADLVWLALVGVAFSIIGAFYYLRIIKLMYFDKPAEDAPVLSPSLEGMIALSVNGLLVLVLGVYPTGLLTLCGAAIG